MSDETEIAFEDDLSRDDVADRLETFAGDLRGTDELAVEVGDETVTIDPPETVAFEIELEDEADGDGVVRSVEFELEWPRGEDEAALPVREAAEDESDEADAGEAETDEATADDGGDETSERDEAEEPTEREAGSEAGEE